MIEVKKNNFLLNEEVNTSLNNIIKKKSFANGYIFYGAEGVGKKQTALRFIKEIFKQSSPSENIEERIANNNHPDFLIILDSLFVVFSRWELFDLLVSKRELGSIMRKSGWLLLVILSSTFSLCEDCLKISFINPRAVCFFPTPSAP